VTSPVLSTGGNRKEDGEKPHAGIENIDLKKRKIKKMSLAFKP